MKRPTTLQQHWEQVYRSRPADGVSWFQPHAVRSLSLIRATGLANSAAIIDVGGGASPLVDDLLDHGYGAVTVLDLSGTALATAQQRLGPRAARVQWIEADVTAAGLPHHGYDIWHDRAVFHFLTAPQQRRAYLQTMLDALKPGGHAIIATFAEDGPTQCSGLPVRRYSAASLQSELGAAFTLVQHEQEAHRTPTGQLQKFIYCCFLRNGP